MNTILTSLIIWLACTLSSAFAKTPGEVEVGQLLREAQLQGLMTPNKKLSSFRGKPLLINVWASWCGPCQAEAGSIERLSRRYGGKHFNVIGISTDDYNDRALGFLKHFGITFSNFIDSQLMLENMLGADHLPLTLLVDAQGRVLAKHYGGQKWDSSEAVDLIAKTFGLKL